MPAEKDVVVQVGGDTTALKSEMRKGSKSVSSFGKTSTAELKKVALSMGKLAAAALAAGSAITAGLVKRGSEAIDAQAKLAKALQTTVSSIQTLQRVAELEGISSLVPNMEALTRRLSRAANDTGPAVKALDQLHLSAEQLLALPADERLELIGKRMKELIEPTQQQAIAFDLFDASGAKIAETINDGGVAIRAARKEIEQLGLTLTKVEASQVEAANDAMLSFNDSATLVQNRLAIEFAPVLEMIGKKFADLIKNNKGFKESIRTAFDVGAEVMAVFADAIDVVQIAIQGIRVSLAGLTALFAILFNDALSKAGNALKSFIGETVQAMNFLILDINELLGTDFEKIKPPDLKFLDVLQDAGPKATKHLMTMRQELLEMVQQFSRESSGDKIRAFMQTIVAEARKAGVALESFPLEPLENVGGPAPDLDFTQQFGGDTQGAKDLREAFQKLLADRLETLRGHLATEQEVEIQAHRERLEELAFLADEGVLKDEERRRLQEELELAHVEKLMDIKKKSLTELEKFQALSFTKQTHQVLGEMINMTNGVTRQSKALFEINKAAATGQAAVNAALGISRTLAEYPFPISVAMAGLQAAAAVAQISAIQSQSFGGGGPAPSVAGSTAAPPVSNVGGGGGGGGGGQNQTIILKGDRFSQSDIRALITELNEASKNGARLVVQ